MKVELIGASPADTISFSNDKIVKGGTLVVMNAKRIFVKENLLYIDHHLFPYTFNIPPQGVTNKFVKLMLGSDRPIEYIEINKCTIDMTCSASINKLSIGQSRFRIAIGSDIYSFMSPYGDKQVIKEAKIYESGGNFTYHNGSYERRNEDISPDLQEYPKIESLSVDLESTDRGNFSSQLRVDSLIVNTRVYKDDLRENSSNIGRVSVPNEYVKSLVVTTQKHHIKYSNEDNNMLVDGLAGKLKQVPLEEYEIGSWFSEEKACLIGWAVRFSGQMGFVLRAAVGIGLAGRMILKANGLPVPKTLSEFDIEKYIKELKTDYKGESNGS
jgi:hypothetical protein